MRGYDRNIFWATIIIVLFGTVMVYSASSITSQSRFGDPMFFLKRQLIRLVLGFGAMALGMWLDYHIWQRYAVWAMIGICAFLLLPLIPQFAGMGPVKGASRWVRLFGSSSLQPSELAKFAMIIFLAEELSRRRQLLESFCDGIVPIIIPVAVLLGLIVLQPNFGMVIGLSFVAVAMMLVAGIPIKHFVYVSIPGFALLGLLMLKSHHAFLRLKSFFTSGDPLHEGYQIAQSLIALGSGGIFGVGLGQSKQKIFYLPEAHTDFIFAVIGEELGLVGATAVVMIFAYITWRGIRVALRAPDRFGAYLAFGSTATIFTFAMINLGVVTRLLPTTGIPLPFVSYGGSQLVVHMFIIGVLLNISSAVKVPVAKPIIEIVGRRCAT
ncbi:putative lipid II flippase FtsW [bacterium]|nr:putative lipid II flippase FtsW [bacterium]